MNRSVLFRELDDAEVAEFRAHARANHKPGDHIEREIWHPVIVAECELIDAQAGRCVLLHEVKAGDFVKRKPNAKTVYVRGHFVPGENRYALSDFDDVNREIFLDRKTPVYIDFLF
jgi:hypothetical protein